jgi:hypothetical protein
MPHQEVAAMELVLLTVPDCPNAPAFEERLAAALTGRPDAVVRRHIIASEHEAAAAGMHGSPTLLVGGTDPFAAPGQPPSLSCRLYRDASGQAGPVPSVQELRRVLTAAGDGAAQ